MRFRSHSDLTDYTNSLVNADSFYTYFTNTTFQKKPHSSLNTYYKTESPSLTWFSFHFLLLTCLRSWCIIDSLFFYLSEPLVVPNLDIDFWAYYSTWDFGMDILSLGHFGMKTFRHGDFSTHGLFGTGTFRHRDILTWGHFSTGTLWDWNILAQEYFGRVDVSAQNHILAQVPKYPCAKMFL